MQVSGSLYCSCLTDSHNLGTRKKWTDDVELLKYRSYLYMVGDHIIEITSS